MEQTKKERRQKKNRRDTVIVLCVAAVFVVLVAVLLFVLLRGDADTDAKNVTTEVPNAPSESQTVEAAWSYPGLTPVEGAWTGEVGESLSLELVGSYSGAYFEDGSDETVDRTLAVVVKNTGTDWIYHAKLAVSYGTGVAWFRVNALPAGAAALVLESNGQQYASDMRFESASADIAQNTVEPVTDFAADFALYCATGVINIQNISGQDFANKVQVYYKNYDKTSGLYLGGIAYTVSADGIAAGETYQCLTEHYTEDGSVILYMTYDE